MNKLSTTVAIVAFISAAAPAFAQKVTVSGGVEVVSQYVLRDAFAATPEPATQGYASVDVGEFSLNFWGSKGITTDIGDELDVGFAWKKQLSDNLSVKLIYNRYLLNGTPDIDEFTLTVASGDFDASYTNYVWLGDMEDGQRVNVGYNYSLSDNWSGRFDLTGETGLGLSDSIVIGGDLNYAVNDNVSLGATVLIPFTEEDDGRDVEFIASASYSF